VFSSGGPSTRKTWTCWSRFRGGHKNNQKAGTPLLWGKAERVGIVQPGEEKALETPYSSLSVPEEACNKAGEVLFTKACTDRTTGNAFKLTESRFRLDVRKKFFMMRVVRHWNSLPREVVAASSLEVLKPRLDGALNNLSSGRCRCPWQGGCN